MLLNRARAVFVMACVSAVCAAACGNGLAPGTGGDRALKVFRGRLAPGDDVPIDTNPRLGIVWTDPLQRQPDVGMPSAWLTSTLDRTTFGGFDIALYRPPPPAAMFRIDTPDGRDSAEMAFGELFIFDDAGEDGAFQIDGHAQMARPDSYLAGTAQVIVYVARPFSSAQNDFPLGPAFNEGYTDLDFACQGQVAAQKIGQDVEMQFVLQPSQTLPEIRTCLRTHSP